MFESWHSIIYLLQIKEAMYEVVNKILIEIQINCNNLQGKLTKQLQPPIECAGVFWGFFVVQYNTNTAALCVFKYKTY